MDLVGQGADTEKWLSRALGLRPTESPFPWQRRLLSQFLAGELPRALDLPTGLGKTAVMAIWLVARAMGAQLPRRLVYVVDRRAVVDQATTVAESLRKLVDEDPEIKEALGLERRSLPISTLRGQHLDNREWLDDPSIPAIVVGTVDLVGSRLLFEGYGVSRKMRPYHAGFLGADTLLVLDEAHLVPPFERLIEAVADGREQGLGPHADVAALVPALHLLSLSATGRAVERRFSLDDEDRAHPVVQARLNARKILDLRPAVAKGDLAVRLAEEAYGLASRATEPTRVLVFCDTRDDAVKAAEALRKITQSARASSDIELFVGGRRAYERETLASWLRGHGFIAGSEAPTASTFLIATSAGEVGVDLDADVAVMDVVAWERMVQRLGRINRRGKGSARVVMIPIDGDERSPERRAACLQLLQKLPSVEDGLDGSPGAIGALRSRASNDPDVATLLADATTPALLHPPLNRPLVDAWAMTSLELHTGRPLIEPWLRGWLDDDEPPQVSIAFRDHLPIIDSRLLDGDQLAAFMDVAGPHASEELETEVWRVWAWFDKRIAKLGADAARAPLAVAFDRNRKSTLVTTALLQDRRRRERLENSLDGGRLLIDSRLQGLEQGLLAADAGLDPDALSLDLTQRDDTGVPFRVRKVAALDDRATPTIRLDKTFEVEWSEEGEPTHWLVVERRVGEPISESGRSIARRAQGLGEHQRWTENEVATIAQRLRLPAELTLALRIAARLHDEGKKAERWQRAFHVAASERPLAKSTRAPNVAVLGGYRHELGSLRWVEADTEFASLSPEYRDVVLHVVAAHHGRARPNLPVDGADEPPTKLRERAREIALRYERLSRRFGPWGLAWIESLLRAADVRASRKNDEVDRG